MQRGVMISVFVWDKEAPKRTFIPEHCAHTNSLVNCRGDNPGDEKYKHLIEPVGPGVQIYGQMLIGNI